MNLVNGRIAVHEASVADGSARCETFTVTETHRIWVSRKDSPPEDRSFGPVRFMSADQKNLVFWNDDPLFLAAFMERISSSGPVYDGPAPLKSLVYFEYTTVWRIGLYYGVEVSAEPPDDSDRPIVDIDIGPKLFPIVFNVSTETWDFTGRARTRADRAASLAISRAIKALDPSEADLAVTAIESVTELDSFRTVIRAIKYIVRRDYIKALDTLLPYLIDKVDLDSVYSLAKVIAGKGTRLSADLWLAFWFAIKPLLEDIYAGYKAALSFQGTRNIVYGRGMVSFDLTNCFEDGVVFCGAAYARAKITAVDADGHVDIFEALGLKLTAGTVYNVIPLSWLLDWVVNLGEFLNNLRYQKGYLSGNSYVSFSVVGVLLTEEDAALFDVRQHGGRMSVRDARDLHKRMQRHFPATTIDIYTRHARNGLPSPPITLTSVGDRHSWWRTITGAALIRQFIND